MSTFLKYLFAPLLLLFISCNPDEDLDNTGNNGNSGNNGNGGGSSSAMSYPEIVNMLEGNWYADSMVLYYSDGAIFNEIFNQGSTNPVGYFTFGSNSIGSVDFTAPEDGITVSPPYENLIVNKYAASVTITNGSWSGSGIEQLTINGSLCAWEGNGFADKSYCIVEYTTPCFNITTPTIEYGIITGLDIRLGGFYSETEHFNRIHTLNDTTLKLVGPFSDIGYVIYTYTKQ
jgi:hypothetical protein